MAESIEHADIICRRCLEPSGHTVGEGMEAFACKQCFFFQYVPGHEPEQPLLQTAATILQGECSKWHVTVERGGLPIELSIDYSSSVPVGVRIFARIAPFPEIEFTQEGTFERVGRSVGIFREVEIGDPTFDAHVWVCAGVSAESAQRMLRDPNAKQAIKNILASPHRREISHPSISVRTDPYGLAMVIGLSLIKNPKDLLATVDEFHLLAKTLQSDMSEAHRPQPMTPPMVMAVIVSLAIIASSLVLVIFLLLR